MKFRTWLGAVVVAGLTVATVVGAVNAATTLSLDIDTEGDLIASGDIYMAEYTPGSFMFEMDPLSGAINMYGNDISIVADNDLYLQAEPGAESIYMGGVSDGVGVYIGTGTNDGIFLGYGDDTVFLGYPGGGDEVNIHTDSTNGFLDTIGTWSEDDVRDSMLTVPVLVSGSLWEEITMPYDGSIIAISISSSAAAPGTVTVEPSLNGPPTGGLSAVLTAGMDSDYDTTSAGSISFSAGDEIGVLMTTDATWGGQNFTVNIVVEYDVGSTGGMPI